MNKDVFVSKISFNKIFDISATLAQCRKDAYKGLVNDDYLSSLKSTHWVKFLETTLNDKAVDCIVAENDNKIIGVSIFGKSITKKFPSDGEVISLYIVSEYIGRNVGHLLFEKAQQSLKEQGYANCIICTFVKNTKAIKFYKPHGFEGVAQDENIKMGKQELQYIILRKKL